MSELGEIDVVVVDCQATGARPDKGALLELGWAIASARRDAPRVHAHWIAPPPGHEVPRVVRRLTGFDDSCLATAISPDEGWSLLRGDARSIARGAPAPAIIHYASFELPFLHDLHARAHPDEDFPLDVVCLHAIAKRLFPELPRRSLRALAGFLGHSADLSRRARGHVEATAFAWRELVPRLEQAGIASWRELRAWSTGPAPRRARRVFPLPSAARRALPDAPGVYRFVRSNGDVLYVGKAASLKKRVASHFTAGRGTTERALEMLTQVHDVEIEVTETTLEAALLEADEIKRLDPPYNVQLREGDRLAWFASIDLRGAAPAPDDAHPLGPLPSRAALSSLGAMRALASGSEPTDALRASALGVPGPFAPDEATFGEAWASFAAARSLGRSRRPLVALLRAARALWPPRDDRDDEPAEEGWTAARVERHLERALVRSAQLLRRARLLTILCDADVEIREANAARERLLAVEDARIVLRRDLADAGERPARAARPWRARQAAFDAPSYDRLRVLATELARVQGEGGVVRVRVGPHVLAGERAARLLRPV